jgi:hypothetical protein
MGDIGVYERGMEKEEEGKARGEKYTPALNILKAILFDQRSRDGQNGDTSPSFSRLRVIALEMADHSGGHGSVD